MRTIGYTNIGDGAGSQVMAGEQFWQPRRYAAGRGGGYTQGGLNAAVTGTGMKVPRKDYNVIGGSFRWRNQTFGSPHPVGMNVLMADGAVRFMNYDVDAWTWMCLCHRMDGNAVNLQKDD
jgi:prepilin-type processing-associated H-X9-DG protein